MAVYNELQVGRYVRFFQKFFGIKGRQPAPLQFSGEVGAFVPLMHGSENRYLEGWHRFTQFWNQAALANNPSVVVLRNPALSNAVCIIEKFLIAVATADVVPPTNFILFKVAADQATVLGSSISVDSRVGKSSAMIASRGNAAVATHAGIVPALAANTPFDLIGTDIQEWGPIMPGDGFGFQTGAPAGGIAVSAFAMYRERTLEEGELT